MQVEVGRLVRLLQCHAQWQEQGRLGLASSVGLLERVLIRGAYERYPLFRAQILRDCQWGCDREVAPVKTYSWRGSECLMQTFALVSVRVVSNLGMRTMGIHQGQADIIYLTIPCLDPSFVRDMYKNGINVRHHMLIMNEATVQSLCPLKKLIERE